MAAVAATSPTGATERVATRMSRRRLWGTPSFAASTMDSSRWYPAVRRMVRMAAHSGERRAPGTFSMTATAGPIFTIARAVASSAMAMASCAAVRMVAGLKGVHGGLAVTMSGAAPPVAAVTAATTASRSVMSAPEAMAAVWMRAKVARAAGWLSMPRRTSTPAMARPMLLPPPPQQRSTAVARRRPRGAKQRVRRPVRLAPRRRRTVCGAR